MKINAFTMRYDIWKGRKKKFGKRRDRTTGRSHQKDDDTRFTICTTGADVSVHSAVLLLVLPVPWLTDVSSSQQWVIYSQTNGAVSNYTYLFRFLWFVVVFSDLLFCFRDCCCVFRIIILFFRFAFTFVICYFVFRIVICFALHSHRSIQYYHIVYPYICYIYSTFWFYIVQLKMFNMRRKIQYIFN